MGGRRSLEEQKARAEADVAQRRFDSSLRKIHRDIKRLFLRTKNNAQRLNILRDEHSLREKRLQSIKDRYQRGISTLLELEKEKADFEEFQTRRFRACQDTTLNQIELLSAAGLLNIESYLENSVTP